MVTSLSFTIGEMAAHPIFYYIDHDGPDNKLTSDAPLHRYPKRDDNFDADLTDAINATAANHCR